MDAPRGLREQKKARYRAELQAAALALCVEKGYASVTTKEIAERADLSESTLFRTFGTKAAVVVADFFLDRFVAEVVATEPGVTVNEALHRAVDTTGARITPEQWELEPTRRHFVYSIPELFSASYMGLEYGAQDLRKWARERTDPGIHDRTIHMYFGYVLTGFAIAQFTARMTLEQWLHELHIAIDLVRNGIQLEEPNTDSRFHIEH